MPYIDKQFRDQLDPTTVSREHLPMHASTPGELNFQITRLVDRYILESGGSSYAKINEVVGVLDCAKLEFYRRIATIYEDGKLAQNGDAYQNGQRT